MRKERCKGCRLPFADYDRKIQVMVDGNLELFHPTCFGREKDKRQQTAPPPSGSIGSRMTTRRDRRER